VRRLALALLVATTPFFVGEDARADIADLFHYQALTLSNGLRVYLLPDHTHPDVAIVTWYKVGSGDEDPGRSGFAHLFEHLMFQGSPHAPKGVIDQIFEESGGWTNAFTSFDQTVYSEVAAAPVLERALWLEADRIAGLPQAIDQAKLDNQRDVVMNERRETNENRPYGMAELLIADALWPEGHAYHIDTIGKPEDLRAAKLEDVRAFFSANYTPRNAVMVIAGDFDPAVAKPLVEKYLGWIPAPPLPRRAPVVRLPPLEKEKVLTATDDVQAPRVYLCWRAAAAYSGDDPALDLAAWVLAGGKSSRLYQRLVVDMRLAQDVAAAYDGRVRGGMIEVVATAKPGVDPAKLTAALDVELSGLTTSPPDADELARAQNSREAAVLHRLQGIEARAEVLASYAALLDDPDYLAKDLARYRAVTPADIVRVTGQYMQPGHRVVLTINPGAKAHEP
jgi:zinc protease